MSTVPLRGGSIDARTIRLDPRHRAWLPPVVVGLTATVIAVAFDWVPSVWYDEAATVVSATRPWPALAREVQHVDVVHATFYGLMHLWFLVAGYAPFTLRLPSAVAVGAAAALLVVLGRMLADLRTGVVAGALFALLPRVTWMGTEGRSFALGTLLAVAATILFLAAHRRSVTGLRSWPWWVGYVAVSLLGGAVFLYLVLVTVGHGVTAAVPLARRTARTRGAQRALRCWLLAAAVTVVALVPLARASATQSAQIDWIQHISRHTVEEVVVTQWFTLNPAFTVFGWLLAVAGVAVGLTSARGRSLLAVALPWAAVPTVGLIAASLVTNPLYSPRYVSFGAPAVALCMALPVAALPDRFFARVTAGVLLLAVALTAPTWVQQRTVTAKDDSAWNQVARLVRSERAHEPAGQVDAVVYGPVDRHPLATSRIIAETYPRAFRGLRDPLLVRPASASAGLWETQRPISDIGRTADGARVVWLLTGTAHDERSTVSAALAPEGYRVDGTWVRASTEVVRYVRAVR
ncbi:hypothetical protein [Curtobacterium sp. MCBD17_040]|uniref:glycosyltransferase family 39 protein n=1 Tax=Curtobacterium sp. MCBD17_040 TaxID=2175674 RepID=UPI0011B75B9F|nr:hypothetical protein [Curtobacterium sp. MCBD17_040]WIB63099.1 hypothetical protein DEI94_13210 [Curtobacterium sp. MCBD17_040]